MKSQQILVEDYESWGLNRKATYAYLQTQKQNGEKFQINPNRMGVDSIRYWEGENSRKFVDLSPYINYRV